MKFTVDYPIVTAGYDPALVTAAGMTRVAQTAEERGYDAISFSEHPAPSQKWLDAGGHESLDQTPALAFCAAVTSRIRLMTYLLVLPLPQPVPGGQDAEHSGPAVRRPQPGGPPVLIGGNSAIARERAARNQGWSPLLVSPEVARTSRTASSPTPGWTRSSCARPATTSIARSRPCTGTRRPSSPAPDACRGSPGADLTHEVAHFVDDVSRFVGPACALSGPGRLSG